MTNLIRRTLITAIAAFLIVPAAMAALSADWTAWGNGPVRFLMTEQEAHQWETISTDADAKAFAELFWARRDPTPKTPANEFKEAFEARVKYADEHFKTDEKRGALTDRGKTLILLGPPAHAVMRNAMSSEGRARTPQSEPVEGKPTEGEPSPQLSKSSPLGQEAARSQAWEYEGERIPPFAGGHKFEITFIGQRGSKDFRLGPSRVNVAGLFEKAVKAYDVSPELTAPPKYEAPAPAAPQAPPAMKTLPTESIRDGFEAYNKGGQKAEGGIFFSSGEFVTADGRDFVAVQLYVPASVASMLEGSATFFGQVETASGEPEVAWEEPAAPGSSGQDRWIDRSLELPTGEHRIALGIARDGKVLAIAGGEVDVKKLDATAPGTSQMILSNRIYPLDKPQSPTDPFAFGGLKVVPKSDHLFTPKDELWYFIELRNPGLNADGAPSVQVKLDVEGKAGDKPVHMAAPMAPAKMIPLRGVPGQFAVGTAIPLATFKPGDYSLKVRVFDSISKTTWNFEQKFRVVE